MTTTAPAPPAVEAGHTAYAPSTWHQLRTLGLAMLRGFVRDRTALFFTFVFPLMFLVVFGLVFSNDKASRQDLGVVGTGALVQQLPKDVFATKTFPTWDKAVAAVRGGDIPAVVRQQGGTVELRYAASDRVKAATIQGILGAVVDRSNVAATGQPPRTTLVSQQVENAELKPIQFLTPGLLSWGIAFSAAFGASMTIVGWRRRQVLRKLRLAPVSVSAIVGARVGVSLLTAFAQAALFFVIASLPIDGLRLDGSAWLCVPLLVAGTLAFLSIGLLVGSVARTEEAASALANFIVLPMSFLSGTFFDISQAPSWLQTVSQGMPLRHMNDAMIGVLARGQGAGSIVAPMAILLGFAAVVTFIASRFFRWDVD